MYNQFLSCFQVQFRLKQIVDASPEEKEQLLKELEEFANRGIPDVRSISCNENIENVKVSSKLRLKVKNKKKH